MSKMTASILKTVLEETDSSRISDYLNSDETHESVVVGRTGEYRYHCRVLLEENIKSPRVRMLLLVFPMYCHERTIDDFFIAEYTARKEREPMHSYNPKEYPFEYRYIYARLKGVESALSFKYDEYHEMIEEMADTDVEISEFRKDFRTKDVEDALCLIQYEKYYNKYNFFPDVTFAHMKYYLGLVYKNIEKKAGVISRVTSCLLFVPFDEKGKRFLDEYNSYIVHLKSDRKKEYDEYKYSNSEILDIEDAEFPADEKIAEKVAKIRKEMLDSL